MVTTDLNTLTPEQLVQSIIGSGVSFSNISFTGDLSAGGLFTGGIAEGLGIETGVILSSGDIANSAGPNENPGTTTEFGTSGDADLDNLIPGSATQDAVILEFEFIPQQGEISFQYVFASEEYNEFVDQFNDAFAFFLNGENIALLPDSDTPISINTINQNVNSDFFNNNDFGTSNPTPFNTEFDGFTTVLTARASVTPDETNRIKLVVADNLDGVVDSAVFLVAGSFVSTINAVDDQVTTFANQDVEIPVLANDSDPDSDPLQIVSFDLISAQGGSVSLSDNNTPSDLTDDLLIYMPASDFIGTDSFTYAVSDGGATATATVEVTVNQPINTPPVTVNDSDITDEDTSLTILTSDLLNNDSDADGDLLILTEVENPINGAVSLNNNGDVVFTPTANFNGLASFEYTISDGIDQATASVEITVNPINDAPIVNADIDDQRVREGEAFSLTLPNNLFTDIDQGDMLTITTGLLPTWLNYDSTLATLQGSPTTSDVGTVDIELIATDLARDSISTSFTLIVEEEVPKIDGLSSTIYVNSSNTIVGNAFDTGENYEGDLFSQTDSTFALGASANDIITGTIQDDNIWSGMEGNDLISSRAGNDKIGISDGDVSVEAGTGDDFVYAISEGGGTNNIDLGAASDRFWAKTGNNSITGLDNNEIGIGTGNDIVTTAEGDDFIYTVNSGGGINTLDLGEGDNRTYLESGDYTITAGDGDDELGLGTGADFINAGNGDNIIYMVEPNSPNDGDKDVLTGQGNDWVQTGSGNDLLNLGTNHGDLAFDTAYGQGGSDIFVLNIGLGYLTIGDFVQGEDRLGLEGLTFSADIGITTDTGRNSTWLWTNSGDIVAELQNFTGALTESDFTAI